MLAQHRLRRLGARAEQELPQTRDRDVLLGQQVFQVGQRLERRPQQAALFLGKGLARLGVFQKLVELLLVHLDDLRGRRFLFSVHRSGPSLIERADLFRRGIPPRSSCLRQ